MVELVPLLLVVLLFIVSRSCYYLIAFIRSFVGSLPLNFAASLAVSANHATYPLRPLPTFKALLPAGLSRVGSCPYIEVAGWPASQFAVRRTG